MEMVQDEVVIEEPAPIDFNWVEETEEISNCDDIILEQDIPASLEEEVVTNSSAEIEEDDMSDGYDTSPSEKTGQSHSQNSSTSSIEENPLALQRFISINPRSLLKRHYFDVNEELSIHSPATPQVKFKQKLLINKSTFTVNQPRFAINTSRKKSCLKSKAIQPSTSSVLSIGKTTTKKKPTTQFKKTDMLTDRDVPQNKMKVTKKTRKQRNQKSNKPIRTADSTSSSDMSAGGKISKRGNKKFVDLHGGNITINHDADNADASINSHPTIDPNVGTLESEPVVVSIILTQSECEWLFQANL